MRFEKATAGAKSAPHPMVEALASHWPEYLMEAVALGIFMVAACMAGALLGHPASPISQFLENPVMKRAAAGIAMGLTAVGIIYSPWGKRSGAHMNPSVTLAYLALGKVKLWDAVFYIAAQFLGGITGVWAARLVIGLPLSHTAVNYVTTVPGNAGPEAAFVAETLISLILMITILYVSNTRQLARYTPWFAGALVATWITVEAPLSGMSMNPARTFGSAMAAGEWTAIWIYFTAPVLGMAIAAQLYRLRRGADRVFCAKLHHHNQERCIFRCRHGALGAGRGESSRAVSHMEAYDKAWAEAADKKKSSRWE